MPLSKYFGGKGASVMADMKERYGEKGGERAFYATVNSRKKKSKLVQAAERQKSK